MAAAAKELLEVAGRTVAISNPDKVFFPAAGYRKRDLVLYYLAVAEGALRAVSGRPMQLKRYPDGVAAEAFYQKRAPTARPPWMETVTIAFPSGRTADELVVRDAAQLAWIVNLGCVDLHPHPLRADDLDHPDELRIDLDPVPGVGWDDIRRVALEARAVLEEHGLTPFVKTSGSRGIHLYARIHRRWGFDELRHAALAVAREVERRAPAIATSKWWKEERHGVFLDYNQNARDRTIASAWSVRPLPDARVSTPLAWEELDAARPEELTLATVPRRLATHGDPWREMDAHPGALDALLALSERQLAEHGEAPLPPHTRKLPGEPVRARPSVRRGTTGKAKAAPRAKLPVLTIARAQRREDALAGLERWKARHASVVPHLQPADVIVDSMRGRYTAWTRVRINLQHVPEAERPAAEPPDPDFDPATAR